MFAEASGWCALSHIAAAAQGCCRTGILILAERDSFGGELRGSHVFIPLKFSLAAWWAYIAHMIIANTIAGDMLLDK